MTTRLLIVVSLAILTACGQSSPPAPSTPLSAAEQQKRQLARQGMELFNKRCASCHGKYGNGTGGLPGPALTRKEFTYGKTPEALRESISKGRPKGMPAYPNVPPQELDALISFILTL
jgi:cytochrome c oxidase cbb3-type subunit 3